MNEILVIGVGLMGERYIPCFLRTSRVKVSVCEMDRSGDHRRDEINKAFQGDDFFINQANSYLEVIDLQPSHSSTIDEVKHMFDCQMIFFEKANQISLWQNINKSECLVYERKNS